MHQDIVDCRQHQRPHDTEQIAVLQRLGEHHEQLGDLACAGVGEIAGLVGARQQQQEAAEERADGCENQVALHGLRAFAKLKTMQSSYDGSASNSTGLACFIPPTRRTPR